MAAAPLTLHACKGTDRLPGDYGMIRPKMLHSAGTRMATAYFGGS